MLVRRRARREILAAVLISVGAVCGSSTAEAANDFAQRLSGARVDYFRGLQGDSTAEDRALTEFTALDREHPRDPIVMAYRGSLQLLQAGRTWAVWNKHRLASNGLAKLDESLTIAPHDLEVRFIHAETTWHLPFFYHRKDEAERDFAYIAQRAERAAATGALPAELAAAALDDYGRILAEKRDSAGARRAFLAAVRVDGQSPGGRDASSQLKQAD